MKKTVSLMLTAMLAAQCLMAQLAEGIKFLNYDKTNSAKEAFQKAYDANPKDPQNIYWLGQALMATEGGSPSKEQVAAAKATYQKGLQEIGSDPWLLVGMGHVEILEGGDINAVKQKFEQAITATTETKGKNKGKPNPAILNAIGRANAYVESNMGDHLYAIDKLRQAAAIDLTNPDIYINMGINYLKLGGENGGEAVKAYQEAILRDPKNAKAMYRIGKIYQSQNNKDLFELNFNNAIMADPAFPPVYYAYYEYYANKDVSIAKGYLDKFVTYADKDPVNDLYLANYLFLAGRNTESLAKAKELDATVGSKVLPKLDILFALNYDRIGDSVQAKKYLIKYFTNVPADKIVFSDYELAAKVFSKFPGNETEAVSYLEKAISNDTSKVNKLIYMGQAAELFENTKMYSQQLQWLQKAVNLKGSKTEFDYYKMSLAALNAKEYPNTIEITKMYMAAFPEKPQPYIFFRKAAIASDPDTSLGTAVGYLSYLDSVLSVVNLEKYKKEIFLNLYYTITYYINKINSIKNSPGFKVKTDGEKTEAVDEFLAICQKALEVTDSMLLLYSDPADDNNKFTQNVKGEIQKNIDYYTKSSSKKAGGSGGSGITGKLK